MSYLVLIETSGNQRYIFSTNKLRENVGASELTYQVGTECVLNAVGRDYDYEKDKDGNALHKLLLAEKPIENEKDEKAVEIIIATSGKALLLTKTSERAEEIVKKVTVGALKEMPGLTVHGAIVDCQDNLKDIYQAVKRVHERFEEVRYLTPSNEQRFLRLPYFASCATSGLPAGEIYRHESLPKTEAPKPHSMLSKTKQDCSEKGRIRLENLLRSISGDFYLADNINQLEKRFEELSWLAVIHADGNGLGEIFLKFHKYINYPKGEFSEENFDGRTYLDKYRRISLELDKCTRTAVGKATGNFQESYRKSQREKGSDRLDIPLIPLIMGGDDLTVICKGEYAVKFAHDFLREFENQTSRSDLIREVAKNALNAERLGICAGIAIIKPHYPFHQAYYLAEQLLRSAKTSKEVSPSLSALDYHVLYDSSGVDLDEIRAKFKDFKVARPYIVSNEEHLKSFANDDRVKFRKFSELRTRVETMLEEQDGKRNLPNSQLHTLRERLHLGTPEADAFARTIAHRYDKPERDDEPFKKLYVEKGKESLFFEEIDEDGKKHKLTHFLDAMEIAEFWKGFENGGEE